MAKTLFEKIADKEIPSHIIWENPTHMAFLDINPLAEGHTLVIPKRNLGDYVFELSDADYQELMRITKQVSALLKDKLKVERVLMIVEGFEVPHVHVHLIPVHDQPLSKLTKKNVTQEELAQTKTKITG